MQFTIKLGKAYYFDGFINVRKNYSEYFGDHGDPIVVHIEKWGNLIPYNCKINRKDNPNGTPRIYMSNPYKEWVQSKYKMGDEIKVEILNPQYPTAILLR